MAFKDLFRDKNDVNEKSIVGFVSFTIMVIFAVADLVTGYFGKDLVINDFIYNSFVIVTLGCFGIAEAGKVLSKKDEPAPRPTKHTHVHIHDEDDNQNFV